MPVALEIVLNKMSNSGSSVKFRDPPVEDVLDENSHFYPPAGDESDDDDMMLHDEQQQAEETEHARMSRKKKKQQTDDEEEKSDRMLSQQCRFYEKTFPEVEEVVMVHILNIGGMNYIICCPFFLVLPVYSCAFLIPPVGLPPIGQLTPCTVAALDDTHDDL